jgi:H+/Cl- antiporter ClcA
MSAKILNILTVVFSVCTFTFFIIGCIGYASAERTMRNVAWVVSDDHGFQMWVNLSGFYQEMAGLNQLVLFEKCADGSVNKNNDTCTTCLRDGNAAFALLIIATVFATFTLILSGLQIGKPNAHMQIGSTITSFVASCFSLIGFGLFMGSCFVELDNQLDFSLHYGPGSIIVLLGLLMSWVTVFFQVGALILGNK